MKTKYAAIREALAAAGLEDENEQIIAALSLLGATQSDRSNKLPQDTRGKLEKIEGHVDIALREVKSLGDGFDPLGRLLVLALAGVQFARRKTVAHAHLLPALEATLEAHNLKASRYDDGLLCSLFSICANITPGAARKAIARIRGQNHPNPPGFDS